MLLLRACLALSAAAGAWAQVSPSAPPAVPYALQPSTCYAEYLSIFHWLNADRTQEYSYDLKPLCGRDRALAVPIPNDPSNNYWYFFWAIAGNVSRRTFSCNPAWQPTYFSGGSFIQVYDWAKPTPSPIPGQTDPETGAAVSVPSAPCIVFAHDRPEFDLIDESNPATGGIRLSYSGLTEPTTDLMNKCPPSPIYGGGESPRFLHINLLCDPRQEDLATGAWLFNEVSTCVYEFNVTTKYACGIAGDPYAPPVAAAATPGKNFGFTVLGAVLTVGGYAAFLWADSRGYLDAVRARLPSVLRGGDAGYKAAGSSSSSSSAGFVRSGGAYGSA